MPLHFGISYYARRAHPGCVAAIGIASTSMRANAAAGVGLSDCDMLHVTQ